MMALEILKFMAVNIESLSKNYWILLATMAKSDIVEELFEDGGTGNPETDVTNQTGIYVTKVRLNRDIPELTRTLNCTVDSFFEYSENLKKKL